jgi:type II secretory pathway component PulF
MEEVRLEDVLALGEQLAALDEAGVPLALGLGRPIRPAIERLNASISRRVGSQSPLAEVVASPDLDIPEGYRRLLSEWIASGDLCSALDSRRDLGQRRESYERRMTIGLFYPAMVAVLAACGVAGMAWWLLPVFESTYAQLNEPVSDSVARLQWLRETTPVWLPLVAVAMVFGVLWLRHSPAIRVTSSSRPLGPACRQRLARASEDAAGLVDAGVATPEAMRIAGLTNPDGKAGYKLPPLLAWAGQSGSAGDLRAVGSVYEDLARLGADRVTTYAPMLALVVVGGGAILLYALSLFMPLIELLKRLAI